jgi:hypothetical protein
VRREWSPEELVGAWTLGIAISARARDIRVAQQLGMLVSLPSFAVAVAALVAFEVIHATLGLAVALGVVLLTLNVLGWRITSEPSTANDSSPGADDPPQ